MSGPATGDRDALSCALPQDEMATRIADWKALSRKAVGRSSGPDWISSRYPKDPEIEARLRELIEAESACCGFLEFTVRKSEDHIEAEVRFPPGSEAMMAMIIPLDP